jgi:hypothetical protein
MSDEWTVDKGSLALGLMFAFLKQQADTGKLDANDLREIFEETLRASGSGTLIAAKILHSQFPDIPLTKDGC